ncbi:hypothetical protein KAR48_18175 [bacterium]|nr:hypothetical protein [bacterium]
MQSLLPQGNFFQGILSPEKCLFVDSGIMSEHRSLRKADDIHASEGSSLESVKARHVSL